MKSGWVSGPAPTSPQSGALEGRLAPSSMLLLAFTQRCSRSMPTVRVTFCSGSAGKGGGGAWTAPIWLQPGGHSEGRPEPLPEHHPVSWGYSPPYTGERQALATSGGGPDCVSQRHSLLAFNLNSLCRLLCTQAPSWKHFQMCPVIFERQFPQISPGSHISESSHTLLPSPECFSLLSL